MKDIKYFITEANINTKVTFDLQNDVYNVLAELAYEYNKKNKDQLFNKDAMEDALEFFMDKFYEEYERDDD